MPSTILSDNGVTSGTSGIKTTGSNDGTLALQTTTAGGAATTALTINSTQAIGVGSTPSFGTNGQVLTSGGSTASPTWTSISSTAISNGTSNVTVNSSGGTITAATNGTTGLTIDTSQNVLIPGLVRSSGNGFQSGNATDSFAKFNYDGGNAALNITNEYNSGGAGSTYGQIVFKNYNSSGGSLTERMRLTGNGHLLVATTSNTAWLTVNPSLGATEGVALGYFYGSGSGDMLFESMNQGGGSATNAGIRMGMNSVTSRSINARGTVNTNGSDYAEYMTKCSNFTVAKGDVVGIDVNGKLTNVFADAISFVVKSTDPSYVGGDTWSSPEALGLAELRPLDQSASDEVKAKYAEDKAIFDTALETARQLVDRIAFSGQVPVNVTGTTAGQYIIPVNDNGSIKGQAVSNPTFEQYQIAVGKVIAIESDGRAKIIVKVA